MAENGKPTFEQVFGQLEHIINNEMHKQADADPSVLTRTTPDESGTVPPVAYDVESDELKKLFGYDRKEKTKQDPGRKPKPGDATAQTSPNEADLPPKEEKLAGQSLTDKLKKLIGQGGPSKKAAGSSDMQSLLKRLLNKKAEEGEEDEEVVEEEELVEDEVPVEEDEYEEEMTEEEAKEAGESLADLIAVIKNAEKVETFLKEAEANQKATDEQDYAYSYVVGRYIRELEDQNKGLLSKTASYEKKFGPLEKEAETQVPAANQIDNKNVDPDALAAASEAFKKVTQEKQAAASIGIDWKFLRTQQFIDNAKKEGGSDPLA